MKYELKAYSFGDTLGQGFNLYISNFIPLFIVTLIFNIPAFILSFYYLDSMSGLSSNPGSALNLILNVLNIIISATLTGIFIVYISEKILNEPINIWTSLKKVLPRIPALIGLTILAVIIIIIGLILLVVPGIILGCGLAFVTIVMINEKEGIISSIKRSWELTKGYKWNILGLFIIIFLIVMTIQSVISMLVFTLSGGFQAIFSNSDPTQITSSLILSVTVMTIFSAALMPFQSCVLIVAYFNQKIIKEGYNIEHLTKQFSIKDDSSEV